MGMTSRPQCFVSLATDWIPLCSDGSPVVHTVRDPWIQAMLRARWVRISRRRVAESTVGGGCDLHTDLRRNPLFSGDSRCLFPPRGLGRVPEAGRGVNGSSLADGGAHATSRASHSSFRSWLLVQVAGVSPNLHRGEHESTHEIHR